MKIYTKGESEKVEMLWEIIEERKRNFEKMKNITCKEERFDELVLIQVLMKDLVLIELTEVNNDNSINN